MTQILKRSLRRILITLSVAFLSSCGTVTPKPIEDTQASYDSSTPSQYDSKTSGLLGFTEDTNGRTDGALITNNALKKYNDLILDYAIQFKNEEKVSIDTNDGVKDFIDVYGNEVHWIDAQHLSYFLKLNRWRKEMRDPDTIWAKVRSRI